MIALAAAVINWYTDIGIGICTYPTCIRCPCYGGAEGRQNIEVTLGTKKLEWFGYLMVETFWRYEYSFWQNSRTWQMDIQTPHDGTGRACIASCGNKINGILYLNAIINKTHTHTRPLLQWSFSKFSWSRWWTPKILPRKHLENAGEYILQVRSFLMPSQQHQSIECKTVVNKK